MKPSNDEYIELTGTFIQSKFRSEDESYCVCIYNTKDNGFATVVGAHLPEVDYPVTFYGKWMKHPSFGDQFKVEMIINQLPTRKYDIVNLILSTPAGISRRKSEKLVDSIGAERFWDALYEHPEELYSVADIGKEKIEKLLREIKRISLQRDLQRLFAGELPLSEFQYRSIFNLFHEDTSVAVESIKENPFLLIHASYNFKQLDLFASNHTDFCVNDYRRLCGAAQYLLLEAQGNAHAGLPICEMNRKLYAALKPNGAVSESDCQFFLAEAVSRKDLILSGDLYYLEQSYTEESTITRIFSAMAALEPRKVDPKLFEKLMQSYAKEKGFSLSSDQQTAVWTAMTHQLCVITGGPGTGKSTILDAILYCWKKIHKKDDFLLMAPTGKAAVRMTETTGHPASTIHSTLSLGVGNNPDADVKVSNSLIVIDEASMIDQTVAAALAKALEKAYSGEQHLVIVGDPDQLPSVGYGNVLGDIIASHAVPVCSLNTIYRQAEGNPIITNSLRIRDNIPELLWTGSFKRFHHGSDDDNKDVACKFYQRCVRQFGLENVALLSPYHKETGISTNILNKQLQESINPAFGKPEVKSKGTVFRLHDRVMQLRNTELLSNGDVGSIVYVNPHAESNECCVTVQFENGLEENYTKEKLAQLDLAYAYTVHKAQGSQYKCVIIVLPNKPSSFLVKSILYTAITRAKDCIAIIGPTETISFMIQNDRRDIRFTQLTKRLASILDENNNEDAA